MGQDHSCLAGYRLVLLGEQTGSRLGIGRVLSCLLTLGIVLGIHFVFLGHVLLTRAFDPDLWLFAALEADFDQCREFLGYFELV